MTRTWLETMNPPACDVTEGLDDWTLCVACVDRELCEADSEACGASGPDLHGEPVACTRPAGHRGSHIDTHRSAVWPAIEGVSP